jgi:energy-coupling factor transporter ATP-binding protein EcfA2
LITDQQRLAIASVLSLHPAILCLDEPTSDLDPWGKEQVFALAHSLAEEKGRTLLIVDDDKAICTALASLAKEEGLRASQRFRPKGEVESTFNISNK